MKYRVVEKFTSINGEGKFSGKIATFIRFAYCNLRCSYCDTSWANKNPRSFEDLTKEEILAYIRSQGSRHVTLTGGEPLFRAGMEELIEYLCKNKDLTIEIETNGSIDIASIGKKAQQNLIFTMDYKLPSSFMEETMILENFQHLRKKDVLKFVIANQADLDRAKDLIDLYHLDNKVQIFFSPAFGKINPQEIVEYMLVNNLYKVRLQLQIHKYIWDPNRRGV